MAACVNKAAALPVLLLHRKASHLQTLMDAEFHGRRGNETAQQVWHTTGVVRVFGPRGVAVADT
jgi:hypothetical protein